MLVNQFYFIKSDGIGFQFALVKSDEIEIQLRRPVCLFGGKNVALSRRIADRWRLIGAGLVG